MPCRGCEHAKVRSGSGLRRPARQGKVERHDGEKDPRRRSSFGHEVPKMIGMKKPPTAASVSIRPVAVPMYWCSMSQTRAGTASQAAKAEDEEEADSDPERPQRYRQRHRDEGQQRRDDEERSDNEHAHVPAAIGAVPAEHAAGDAGECDERGQQSAGRLGRSAFGSVTYSLNSCEVVKYAPYPPKSATL